MHAGTTGRQAAGGPRRGLVGPQAIQVEEHPTTLYSVHAGVAEAVLAELPAAVRQAFDLGAQEFSDALDAHPPDQRETTLKQLREAGIIGAGPDMAEVLRNFDPLLCNIAAVAKGDGTDEDRAQARAKIEQVLPKLEEAADASPPLSGASSPASATPPPSPTCRAWETTGRMP